MATQESEATKAAATNGEVKWMSLPLVLHVSGRELGSCVFSAERSLVEYLNLLASLFPPSQMMLSVPAGLKRPPPAFNDVLGNLHC